ncbi:MAG: MoaD/ThiS family protein [Myxococcota bacterium]|nr:MoaD/ThiS family protein [Myxococcota bacterium]
MARIVFSSAQRDWVGGAETLEIEAGRVIDLLNVLYERYPALAGRLDHAAVAIDGDIYNDARFQPLAPDSEVHFMGQISGGR